MFGNLTYLILDIIAFLSVLIFSFRKPVYYYKQWQYLLPAIIITGAGFIIWDEIFTREGIWSFNSEYVTGINILSLPIEEWLFFIIIPFACVFIYENIRCWKGGYFFTFSKYIYIVLTVTLLVIAVLNIDRIYTFTAFTSASIIILLHVSLFKDKFLGIFLIAYLIHLVPFAIMNGILTAEPVVLYNSTENLGIRLGTIPLEDTVYSLALFLMNVTLLELFRRKSTGNRAGETFAL